MQFTEDGTIFNPTCAAIQGMIASMTDSMIATVGNVTRVLYLRPFTEHVSTVVRDPPNVQEIVRSIAEFAVICDAINRKVEHDFAEAQEYVIGFDAVRPIYEYNRRWDFDAYKRQAHSVTSLKEEMEQASRARSRVALDRSSSVVERRDFVVVSRAVVVDGFRSLSSCSVRARLVWWAMLVRSWLCGRDPRPVWKQRTRSETDCLSAT